MEVVKITKADILEFFKKHKNDRFVVVNDTQTYFENIDTKQRYLTGVNWASTCRCLRHLVKEGDLRTCMVYTTYTRRNIRSLTISKTKVKRLTRCYQCN